ncbi:MAG: hypothetical protein R3Y10_10915 [Ferrimonas sp.]
MHKIIQTSHKRLAMLQWASARTALGALAVTFALSGCAGTTPCTAEDEELGGICGHSLGGN